jgi:hypothetical protein
VRVRVPDGSEVEEHLTDAQGQTMFALPAGDCIVYLPVDGQTLLPPPASFFSIAALPDGTRVLNWSTVQIVAGQTTSIDQACWGSTRPACSSSPHGHRSC